MEIRHNKRDIQRKLSLDKGSRDALADYLGGLWPGNKAKCAAREFGLSLDEARSSLAGRASLTTYDKIKKAGGWAVIFAVEAMVLGQGADQYLIELRGKHEQQAKRLDALGVDLWTVGAFGRPDPADDGDPLAERPRSVGKRKG